MTLTSKLRVEKAVTKYTAFLQELEQYDLNPEKAALDNLPASADKMWARFCVVGRSKTGLSVMWVQGGTTLPSMEADLVSVSMNYYMAVHSDLKTLRNGVVFVIDTSNNPDKKVGNESKMQKFFSALPIRPQHFFIV